MRGLRLCGSLPKARFTTRRFAADGFIKVVKNGSFFQRMALSTLSAPAEPEGLFGLVLAGIGIAWNNPPQTLVWPEATRQFNGSNCGTSTVQVADYSCPQSLFYC